MQYFYETASVLTVFESIVNGKTSIKSKEYQSPGNY